MTRPMRFAAVLLSTIGIAVLSLGGSAAATADKPANPKPVGSYERPSGLPNTADAIEGWLN